MRVQFGAIITAGAGKAGGQIIQRGRTGQILRNLTKPVIRTNLASTSPRFALSAVASLWRLLSSGDRTSWQSLASTLTRYNKFGVSYIPNGYQIFCELNLNIVNYFGDEPLQTAPAVPASPFFTDWLLTSVPTGPDVSIAWEVVGGAASYQILGSFFPLQSYGASVPRGSSRFTQVQTSADDGELDMSDAFTARFGDVASGQYQVAIQLDIIDRPTGFSLPPIVFIQPYANP